jgi:acyl-CoA thioester hydrolase
MTEHHADHHPAGPDPRDLTGPFHHRVSITVRFADTDAMRHVNNALYLTYCETARIRYWTDVTGERFGPEAGVEGLILAEARITYRAQTFYGEEVAVESRATRIGRTSFTLEHRLTARQPDGDAEARLVAVSDSVLVRYDYELERAVPLTDEHIGAMEAFEGRRLRA